MTRTLTDIVDRQGLSPLQVRVFLLCGFVALLDGIDNQSIGLVAPFLAQDLALDPTAIGLVFSVSQVGATLGALLFGPLADRFGRKPVILAAVAIIALFTYWTAVSSSFGVLLTIRFLAGIGLAGAIPCVLALASEFAPSRLRGTIVSLIFAAYPLGAALGGFMNAYIMAHYDWRVVFYVGAALAVVVLASITFLMPESLQYLLARGDERRRLERTLRQIDPHADAAALRAADAQPNKTKKVPISLLFAGGLATTTFLLWGLYFFSYATTKIMVVWFPTLVKNSGFAVSAAAVAQAFFNIGCTIGMAGAGRLVDKFGAFRTLAPALGLGAVCVFLMGIFPLTLSIILGLAALIGLFIGIGGSGAHAIAASLYPVAVRSTGIGWGMAASRFGQVFSPMMVALMLSAGFGSQSVYATIAALPLVAGITVVIMRMRPHSTSSGYGKKDVLDSA